MSVAFWSTKLNNSSKDIEVQPPEGYVLNLQQAVCVSSKVSTNNVPCIVKVTTTSIEGSDKLEAVIAVLKAGTTDQVNLSLVFGYDVPAKFSVVCDANTDVYLSGYYQPGPIEDDEGNDEDYDDYDEGDDEDDDDDDDDTENIKNAELALAKLGGKDLSIKGNKIALAAIKSDRVELLDAADDDDDSDDDSEDDDDDDEEEDEVDEKFINKMISKHNLKSTKEDDDSDDEDEDSEDEEEDSEEEEEEAPPMKVMKAATPKGIVPTTQGKATPGKSGGTGTDSNSSAQKPAPAEATKQFQSGQKPPQNNYNNNNNNSKPNTPHSNNKPKTPNSTGNNNNNNNKGNYQNNKSPGQSQYNNKPKKGNGGGFQQSGDKRKR